ncbi:MAG TPA: glycosyltransferase [Anaerolineales bacterium]|nr:glycosyltransferase [Anaerolineales bacterium]
MLYFSGDYGPHDHRFLAALARTPHEVYFLRLARSPRQTENRPIPMGIRQVPWAGGQRPFRWHHAMLLLRDLKRVIKELKPDLIHAGPIQTCAFLAVLSGFYPVLTMSWGFDLMRDAYRNACWRWITSYTLRRSAYFVSDARVTRARAVAFGMPSDRTAVFAWGVDLQRFRPRRVPTLRQGRKEAQGRGRSRPRQRPRASRQFVLLCNRSWEASYGVDVLARAFVMAAHTRSDLVLLLLGDGSQRDAIRQIFEQGHQKHRVEFGGQVRQADLPRWYHRANLYISPSHVDGSSVSLMEALACGTPVLVSDIPGNKEWIREGNNGWLFRDGDARHLAEKILRIAGRRSALRPIGRAARRTAEERADWKRNFQALLQSYERAVTMAPRPGI